jgi:predicted RNA polymerase sigma factor
LMLQTVLGLDAARIAAAFLVKPATMGQRLARAKTKIRDAGIPFDVPEVSHLASRLDFVLEAIYAAFGTGWEEVAGSEHRQRGLADEAIQLGEVLVTLLPHEPEALGLLALMLYSDARRAARRDAWGEYVPLSEQDIGRWSIPTIERAEALLNEAQSLGTIGRFQLEAAIQSAHAQRAFGREVSWQAIATLYEGLTRIAPTIGARVGRAAAIAEVHGAAVAWARLEEIPVSARALYQPYWALAGRLLAQLGRTEESRTALKRAAELTSDPAVRRFLARDD